MRLGEEETGSHFFLGGGGGGFSLWKKFHRVSKALRVFVPNKLSVVYSGEGGRGQARHALLQHYGHSNMGGGGVIVTAVIVYTRSNTMKLEVCTTYCGISSGVCIYNSYFPGNF